MKKDIDFFFKFVADVHPNMYAFVSKDSMEKRKTELYRICSNPLTRIEFQRWITQVNGMFDGHTEVSIRTWVDEDTVRGFFPVLIRIVKGELFFAGERYPQIQEKILSINELSSTEIYNILSSVSKKTI